MDVQTLVDPPNQRAAETLNRIRNALADGGVAGVPEIIQLIQQLSQKAFEITIKELSDLISQDVTVTAKVISAANTVGYNPTGQPVSTITQAIQLIGFERVRNLAIGLLLLENAERSKSPEEQREVAAMALSSGLLAQAVTAEKRTQDPELAFVCASLRNYGRLLMTTFLIEDYRRARQMMREIGHDVAFREVFGLTPLELGYHLLLSAHLPKTILRCLQEIPPDKIRRAATTPEDELLVISEFAVQLTELAVTSDLTATEFDREAIKLTRQFEKNLKFDHNGIQRILGEVESELRRFSRTFGDIPISNHVIRCMRSRARSEDPNATTARPPLAPAARQDNPEIAKSLQAHPQRPATNRQTEAKEDPVLQAIQEITAIIANPPVDVEAARKVFIRGIHLGLRLTDSMLFLRDHGGVSFSARIGVGPLFREVRGKPLITAGNRDVFSICLARQDDILIDNAEEPRIAGYVSDWLKGSHPLKSFILLPVKESERLEAIFCGGREVVQPISVSTRNLQQLKALRIHLATAIRMARGF